MFLRCSLLFRACFVLLDADWLLDFRPLFFFVRSSPQRTRCVGRRSVSAFFFFPQTVQVPDGTKCSSRLVSVFSSFLFRTGDFTAAAVPPERLVRSPPAGLPLLVIRQQAPVRTFSEMGPSGISYFAHQQTQKKRRRLFFSVIWAFALS